MDISVAQAFKIAVLIAGISMGCQGLAWAQPTTHDPSPAEPAVPESASTVAKDATPEPAAGNLPVVIRLNSTTPDAGFRLVKVERLQPNKRINVQINPDEQYRPEDIVDPVLPTVAYFSGVELDSDHQDWFWKPVSPLLSAGNGGRMAEAMAALQYRPSGLRAYNPDPVFMRGLADKYGKDILIATLNKRVSPALVLAVMGVESAGKATAVSSAGATGLMQLIPDTAKRFGVKEITDPAQNITGGAAYLEWLLNEFGQDPLLALAGYNAGENAVKEHGGIPPYAETRAYVPKVVAAWQVARQLCQTPPEYVWQGCVFKTN